jgi:hypothetical protein
MDLWGYWMISTRISVEFLGKKEALSEDGEDGFMGIFFVDILLPANICESGR